MRKYILIPITIVLGLQSTHARHIGPGRVTTHLGHQSTSLGIKSGGSGLTSSAKKPNPDPNAVYRLRNQILRCGQYEGVMCEHTP
jgi:hypothetical protein